jgi:hypothetical protein
MKINVISSPNTNIVTEGEDQKEGIDKSRQVKISQDKN